jgi:N6-adenosine-specific RNA methylase IME4
LSYDVVYADPPWPYNNPQDHNPARGGYTYNTMTMDEIRGVPLPDISSDALLFLWATMPKLPEAISTVEAWGFKFTTVPFVWVKTNKNAGTIYSGLGYWTCGNAEIVLMGKRGKPKRQRKDLKQIVMAPRGNHSAKPDEVRDRISSLVGPEASKIELFARKTVTGWDSEGDQL